MKGGHLAVATGRADAPAPDVVVGDFGAVVLDAERVATGNDHGTGCSLSAAIAANLALGLEVREAVRAAKAFVRRALAGAAGWRLGAGHGPIDHFSWSGRGPRAGHAAVGFRGHGGEAAHLRPRRTSP